MIKKKWIAFKDACNLWLSGEPMSEARDFYGFRLAEETAKRALK